MRCRVLRRVRLTDGRVVDPGQVIGIDERQAQVWIRSRYLEPVPAEGPKGPEADATPAPGGTGPEGGIATESRPLEAGDLVTRTPEAARGRRR